MPAQEKQGKAKLCRSCPHRSAPVEEKRMRIHGSLKTRVSKCKENAGPVRSCRRSDPAGWACVGACSVWASEAIRRRSGQSVD